MANLRADQIVTRSGTAGCVFAIALAYSGAGKTRAQHVLAKLADGAGLKGCFMGQPASDSGILTALQRNNKQLLMWDEFGQALGEMSRSSQSYRVAIISQIMKLYSDAGKPVQGKEYASQERVDIACPLLSILGASTPAEFYKSLTQEFIEKGFLSRFLVFEGAPPVCPKEQSSHDVPESLIQEIAVLHQGVPSAGPGNLSVLKKSRVTLSFESSAIETMAYNASWEKVADNESDEPKRILWSRSLENWYKVCMSLADVHGVVSNKAAVWAWDLVEYLVGQLAEVCDKCVHDSARDQERQRRLEKFRLLIKPGERIEVRAFTKRCYDRGFGKLERTACLSDLLESGQWIEEKSINPTTRRENKFLIALKR